MSGPRVVKGFLLQTPCHFGVPLLPVAIKHPGSHGQAPCPLRVPAGGIRSVTGLSRTPPQPRAAGQKEGGFLCPSLSPPHPEPHQVRTCCCLWDHPRRPLSTPRLGTCRGLSDRYHRVSGCPLHRGHRLPGLLSIGNRPLEGSPAQWEGRGARREEREREEGGSGDSSHGGLVPRDVGANLPRPRSL